MSAPAGPGRAGRLRLVVADDEPVVRTGLRMLLSAEPDLDVVAEAGDGHQAVAAAARHRPDVVLMDVRMPGLDGIAATRRIDDLPGRSPAVLILTTFASDDHLLDALRAGARGFVLKRAEPAEIAHAVRTVAGGGSLVVPAAVRDLLAGERRATTALAPAMARLTPREQDVLRLLGTGLSNGEIGAELFLGTQTVKTHVAAILAKLGCRDRTQAVIAAYDSGFLR